MQRPPGAGRRYPATVLPLTALCALIAWSAVSRGTMAPLAPPASPPSAGAPLDPSPVAHPALKILWDQELLSDPSPAVDVRWASDHSVYVAWLHHGVSQLAMDGNFTALRDLFPDVRGGGFQSHYLPFHRLAVSKDYVVASSLFRTLGFRPLEATGGHVQITRAGVGIAVDLDLSENRLLLLGDPQWGQVLPSGGGIAWLGPLTGHPAEDLRPILRDVGTGRFPNLINCYELQLGGVRFLPDRSLVVIPGSQQGAHLFSSAGQLLRTWDTNALGLDGDAGCAGMPIEELERLHVSETARYAYINQHRVLDDILPLAQGPGLLIRTLADGKVHWQLKVLRAGVTLVYDVPFAGSTSYDRMRGDVRGDRIVLLRTANTDKPYKLGHLYVAELPRAIEPGAVPEGGHP